MSEYKHFTTPLKEEQENMAILQTADLTPERNQPLTDQKVDYKSKTFKLMKQLAETQVLNKKCQTQMRHLQRQLQAYQHQFQKIFKTLSVQNLEQAYKRIQSIMHTDKKQGNEEKVNEWTNIIEEYKKIINTQQYKYIKLEQQFKIAEVKLKRYEQDKFQSSKERVEEVNKQALDQLKLLKEERESYQKNVESLEQQVAILKKQYKQVIIQRDHSKDMFDELTTKYNQQIQHFQEMQKHVEQRLIEVQREMNYYRQEREEHLEKIELMKKEIDYRQSENYYSFGGVRHEEVQTQEDQESLPQFNNQCLEISIKTLLQENQRLKNTLIVLYSKKSDQELPKEIQLELKILLNMKENMVKQEKREASKNYSQSKQENFKLNLTEVSEQPKVQTAIETIEQQQSDEGEQKEQEQPQPI